MYIIMKILLIQIVWLLNSTNHIKSTPNPITNSHMTNHIHCSCITHFVIGQTHFSVEFWYYWNCKSINILFEYDHMYYLWQICPMPKIYDPSCAILNRNVTKESYKIEASRNQARRAYIYFHGCVPEMSSARLIIH